MPTSGMPFGNDNIHTSHLKCDRCRTRNVLKGIEHSSGFETRLFECGHCGAVKVIRIDTFDTIAACSQGWRSFDGANC